MSTKTEIDLTPFCHPDEYARYSLHMPFVQGGMRCDTDGKMAVRIPASDKPDTDYGSRRPKLASIFDRFFDVTEWMPLPDAKTCDLCGGKGSITDECRHCRGIPHHECSCGHAHDCEACEGVGSITSECYRKVLRLNGRDLSCYVYRRLKLLPGLRYGFYPGSKVEDRIYGTFDGGGQVCFMPMSMEKCP